MALVLQPFVVFFLSLCLIPSLPVHGYNAGLMTKEKSHELLQGEWMLEFYAPWCPACQGFSATWSRLAGWSEGKDIKVAQVNVQEQVGLSGQFLISQLPTICHIKDGEVRYVEFTGSYDSLVSYIENESWKLSDPVPAWKGPLALHFRLLGYVVDVTKFAQVAYEKLTIEHGFSNYGVFGIAIGATIGLGFLFGGIMVVCCECFGRAIGPNITTKPPQQPKKTKEQKGPKPENISSSKGEEPDTKSSRKRKNVKIEYDTAPPSGQGQSGGSGSAGNSPKKQTGKKGRMKAEQ